MSANNLSEYPNHLNPFKSRRNSISNSFRKVFRSFRGKDKDRPTKYTDVQPQRHTIQQTGPVELVLPEVLPRSRFKERLEKTEVLKRESKDKHWYNDAINPFEDNPNEDKPNQIPPVPAARKHRKRKKRAAPLPPGSVNGDGQYLDVPSRTGSKWSLTSTDTDISSACYSEAESEYPIEINEQRQEEILEITREIAKFADDSNNNLTVNHDVSIKIEDVDKVDGTQDQKPKNEEENIETTRLPDKEEIHQKNVPQSITEDDSQEDSQEAPTQEVEPQIITEKEKHDEIEEVKRNEEKINKDADLVETSASKIPNGHVIEDTKVISNGGVIYTETKVEESKISNGCVKNVETSFSSSIVKTEAKGCESSNDRTRGLNQNRLRVKIIDNQEVVLRYPEYESEEDENSRLSFQKKLQHFESYRESSQASKIRQTVLTKEKLLGTD